MIMDDDMVEKAEISYKRLGMIADYYEFPMAVFFADRIPVGTLQIKGTRKESLQKKIGEIKKRFNDLLAELEGESGKKGG